MSPRNARTRLSKTPAGAFGGAPTTPTSEARRRLIVALDFERIEPALRLAEQLAEMVSIFKVGSRLFTAEGPRVLERIAGLGARIFLDLKFHDIPNTVAGAVASALRLPGVALVNVHALGGKAMMQAAALAARSIKSKSERGAAESSRPKVIAVTILTSMDTTAMRQVGIGGSVATRTVRLARLAKQAGLAGAVTSGQEIKAVRKACGRDFLLVVPGVRPANTAAGRNDDQARVGTPAATIRGGADHLVVGRPISSAPDPRAATQAILEEISQALAERI